MSKTVDDLVKVYIIAHFGADNGPRNRERYRAGITAVVRALRDAVVKSNDMDFDYSVARYLDKIIGDAGDEVAGNQWTASTQPQLWAKTPATDPAPACEWWVERDPDGDGHYETKCQNGWTLLHGKPSLDGYSFCPSCGKPIKFTEAKT